MNNLAKIEQYKGNRLLHITRPYIYLLLLLYISLLLPHPCSQQGSIYHRHDVVKKSARYRQDITITRQRIAEGSPTVANSKSTSLTVSRCSAD